MAVVLVHDLGPEEALQHVLEGHDPLETPIFVRQGHDMGPFAQEPLEQLMGRHGLREDADRVHEIPERPLFFPPQGGVEGLTAVNDSDHLVRVVGLEEGNAAVDPGVREVEECC